MTKKILAFVLAGAGLIGFTTSCEWSASGSGSSWSGDDSWVDFNGVYKASDGGVLVKTSAAGAAISGGSNATVVAENASQVIGTGDNTALSFSSTLSHTPIVPGSVFISDGVAGFETFSDPAGDGHLVGNQGGTGTINYDTGLLNITFNLPPGSGAPITCTYQFNAGSSGGGGGSSGGGSGLGSGSSLPVYSFTVFQQGNLLTITDSNGATYTGKLGDVSSSGGVDNGGANVFSGDTVSAQFTANGISANGRSVEIVGVLQGVLTTGTGSGGSSGGTSTGTMATQWKMGGLSLQGTWIEDGGAVTGDIDGVSGSVNNTSGTVSG